MRLINNAGCLQARHMRGGVEEQSFEGQVHVLTAFLSLPSGNFPVAQQLIQA